MKCADETFYTGSTKYLQERVLLHQQGAGSNYTSKRLPLELVYYEEFSNIEWAFEREKQIQKWSKGKKEALINNNKKELKLLSECKNKTHFNNFKNNNANNKE